MNEPQPNRPMLEIVASEKEINGQLIHIFFMFAYILYFFLHLCTAKLYDARIRKAVNATVAALQLILEHLQLLASYLDAY